jgi:hypothetical protein
VLDSLSVALVWDPDQALDASARVETAVGVLMELCGWDATKARSRLVSAAASVDAPVETVAGAILALEPEHPRAETTVSSSARRARRHVPSQSPHGRHVPIGDTARDQGQFGAP